MHIQETTKFLSEDLKGRDHSEDLGVEGKIISEWMHLSQDGDQWQTLVNTVMKLRVP
jgi:hypothetical protein